MSIKAGRSLIGLFAWGFVFYWASLAMTSMVKMTSATELPRERSETGEIETLEDGAGNMEAGDMLEGFIENIT